MIDKIKQVMKDIISVAKKLQVIIISLIILSLLGYALLQVTNAVNPTPSPETVNQVKLEQQAKQVRYDRDALEQIRELKNVEANVESVDKNHSQNPFNTN